MRESHGFLFICALFSRLQYGTVVPPGSDPYARQEQLQEVCLTPIIVSVHLLLSLFID